jgi:hypothetical protein
MKTKLNWRLSELPNASEVADLVEQEVITKEEARSILFKTEDERNKDEEVKALREQIKFMEKVVDALTRNKHTTITYTPTYPTLTRWSSGTGSTFINCATTGSNGIATSYSVNTAKLLS